MADEVTLAQRMRALEAEALESIRQGTEPHLVVADLRAALQSLVEEAEALEELKAAVTAWANYQGEALPIQETLAVLEGLERVRRTR